MTKLKRYDVLPDGDIENERGDYCLSTDVSALETRVKELEGEIAQIGHSYERLLDSLRSAFEYAKETKK